MTLVVGVRCQDGVVVGADSAATLGTTAGGQTIWQATDEKVRVVDGRALIAVSGPVGLGQLFHSALGEALKDTKLLKQPGTKVMESLAQAFRPHIKAVIDATAPAVQIIGQSAAFSKFATSTLVAVAAADGPTLIAFDWNGAPEETSPSLPFACIGSGQPQADPFLAFLKGVFWEDGELPTLAQGTLAALWTIDQSIAVAPGGIAGPTHMYSLRGDGSKYVASKLEDADLQEHRQAIQDARAALHDFRSIGQSGSEAPPPP